MLYELRHYIPVAGKEQAIVDRFNHRTLGIFKRIGIKVSDFWLEANGSGHLWYVVDWESQSHMDSTWNTFRADPEWIEAKVQSEANGPIVEKIDVILLNRFEH